MLTRYLRTPIFIQIVKVRDLHFQGQRFKSLAHWQAHTWYRRLLVWVYRLLHCEMGVVKSASNVFIFIRTADDTNSHDIKGCQESMLFAKICQGVLAYNMIVSEIQGIAFSSMAFVWVCPCMCIRSFERLVVGPHKKGLRKISHFCYHHVSH